MQAATNGPSANRTDQLTDGPFRWKTEIGGGRDLINRTHDASLSPNQWFSIWFDVLRLFIFILKRQFDFDMVFPSFHSHLSR